MTKKLLQYVSVKFYQITSLETFFFIIRIMHWFGCNKTSFFNVYYIGVPKSWGRNNKRRAGKAGSVVDVWELDISLHLQHVNLVVSLETVVESTHVLPIYEHLKFLFTTANGDLQKHWHWLLMNASYYKDDNTLQQPYSVNPYLKELSLHERVEVEIYFFFTPATTNLTVTDYQAFSDSRVDVKGYVSWGSN